MTLTVIPPLADPTLRPLVSADDRLLDLNDHLVTRLADPRKLRQRADRADTEDTGPETALQAVFARAAATVLDRPDRDTARLRAIGLALRLASAEDPAVSLSLDDVELRQGTTRDAADVAAAVARTRMFAPEAVAMRAAANGAVSIIVDTDQQLPAAALLAAAGDTEHVELRGGIVTTHGSALTRVPSLCRARLTGPAPPREIRPEWGAPHGVRWVTSPDQVPAAGPWAGWLEPSAAGLPAADLARCRGLVLTIALVRDWPRVVGGDGVSADLAHVRTRLPVGVPLRADVVVGAPGVPTAEAEATVKVLETHRTDIALGGLRPFRLVAGHAWPGVAERDSAVDFPQWRDFTAENAATPDDRRAAVARLLDTHAAHYALLPGRVAAAVLRPTTPTATPTWDPAAVPVTTRHCGPDGKGPGDFVAHLATGRVVCVPRSLARVLRGWADGDTGPLDALSSGHRRSLIDRLHRTGIVRGKE